MALHDEYSLLLLAGGKSARMGTHKAALLYQGKTFLDHMLDKAHTLGIRRCFLSGYDVSRTDVTTIQDCYEDRGPLGGIHACMKAMDTPYCLVLPVDAPRLPLQILEGMLEHHRQHPTEKVLIWEHGVRQEPLIAIYPVAMMQTIEDLIREHSAPVFRVLDAWGYERLRIETDEQLLNVNTPEAYRRLTGEESDTDMEKQTILLQRISAGTVIPAKDEVALEHHLTIPLRNGTQVQVTCTPSHLDELILGRRYLLDDLMAKEYPPQPEKVLERVDPGTLFSTIEAMFENPGDLFQTTGCAHSCILVTDGRIQCAMEDIGRHNALDKVVGFALKNAVPMQASIVFTSGRISRDYLQKAIKAGFRIVVSRAAVTAGAVELARQENITLLGFLRKNTGNIYHQGAVALFENPAD